jgi:hypothetical protein
VPIAVPQPVVVSSVPRGVGELELSSGGGHSSGSSVSSVSESNYSGGARGYDTSSSRLGHVLAPLKGVYVPSYLGGLHG